MENRLFQSEPQAGLRSGSDTAVIRPRWLLILDTPLTPWKPIEMEMVESEEREAVSQHPLNTKPYARSLKDLPGNYLLPDWL